MFKAVRSLFAMGATLFLITLVFLIGFTCLQPFFKSDPIPPAASIVVLGGGMAADGTLDLASAGRVQKGVDLYKQGRAPHLHFTGGVANGSRFSSGEQMSALAVRLGVPKAAITSENLSQSTLQNALFSRDQLAQSSRIILVTEGFHLARSWASMQVFGDYDIALVSSQRFRQSSPDSPFAPIKMILREALAVWFNAARYLVWRAAGWLDIPAQTRDALLY